MKREDRIVGIGRYGAYIPWHRIGSAELRAGAVGEKAVANWDEDSVTMAASAILDCLRGRRREDVDGLFFASTTSPYEEKQISTLLAVVSDLRPDIISADFGNSLRAGTSALRAAYDAVKAGSANQVLVTAADSRLGHPGSEFELNCGDGAASLLITRGQGVVASIEASQSRSLEIIDTWRARGDTFIRSWEDRFSYSEGYFKAVQETVQRLMKQCDLAPRHFAKFVCYAPDARRLAEVARNLGFEQKQIQDGLFATVGNTGCAHSLMALVYALEGAKPGDLILLCSYGNGADALVLRITDQIEEMRDRRGVKHHLASKKVITDYKKYLCLKGLLHLEAPQQAAYPQISASAVTREQREIYPLHGSKCKVCGMVYHPIQRICVKCRSIDQFDEVRLSDKKAKVFSYTFDYLGAFESPTVNAAIDFEGGGRDIFHLTDVVAEEVKLDTVVEPTFRKLVYNDGIHHYYWKATPRWR